MKKIFKLFPSYVSYAPLSSAPAGRALNRELLAEAKRIRTHDVEGQEWSHENYASGYTSYGSLAQLHQMSSTFAKLQNFIDREVAAYARAQEWQLEEALQMNSCWINFNGPHAFHGSHLHPHSVVSGTYYVDVPPGGGEIKLEDPRLAMFMGAPQRKLKCRPENQHFFAIRPQSGHLLLFESYLRHEVKPNSKGGERLSISFNYS